jgi:hypothetical protein
MFIAVLNFCFISYFLENGEIINDNEWKGLLLF